MCVDLGGGCWWGLVTTPKAPPHDSRPCAYEHVHVHTNTYDIFHDTTCIAILRLINNSRPYLRGCQPQTVFLCCMLQFLKKNYNFLHSLLLTLLHKVCKWQASMIFSYWVMTLFPTSCHVMFSASCSMFLGVNLPSCFPTSLINIAIHDGSDAIRQWIKNNFLPMTPVQVIWCYRIWRHNRSRKRLRQ